MICRGCGVHAPDDANYCVNCGSDLTLHRHDEADTDDTDTDDTTGELPVFEDGELTDPSLEPVGGHPPAAALVACPGCGAPNSPRRYLCGRCGADLSSGERNDERSSVVTRSAAAAVPAGSQRRPATGELERTGTGDQQRRWAIAVVAVGLLVGAGLGAAAWAELGPFGSSAAAPSGPEFDPAAYPGEPTELPIASVGASSVLPSTSERRFDPDLMVDGDLTTAWNSAGERNPEGVGEIVEVEFASPVWVSEIVVGNGAQRDDSRYLANARVKEVRFEADTGREYLVTLLDEPGLQLVRLPNPVLTDRVRFEIAEVYPGDTYEDVAISELELRGHVARSDDAEALAAILR